MSDTYRPRAVLQGPGGDYTDPLQQNFKLYLFRKHPDNMTEVIYSDGPRLVTLGTEADASYPKPTLLIPPEFFGPLAQEVLRESRLSKSHDSDTLQEALEVERRRVDDQLEWMRSGKVSLYQSRD
jgi:hypothetical protein